MLMSDQQPRSSKGFLLTISVVVQANDVRKVLLDIQVHLEWPFNIDRPLERAGTMSAPNDDGSNLSRKASWRKSPAA
jgi:hypothetical protein